ncbi:hypothetical protein C5167_050042 [Papaver somniferum]|uniref:Uncharacterized protein n=1 Tax=Papaver somniferum TaxID=3469 RepID=A0A4Y7KRG2_PAPSO|nr:hypothetical protein C5167_050042 [Papaver somniferum]
MAMKYSFAAVCLIIAMSAIVGMSEVAAHNGKHHAPVPAPAPAPAPKTSGAAFLPISIVSAFVASAGIFLLSFY